MDVPLIKNRGQSNVLVENVEVEESPSALRFFTVRTGPTKKQAEWGEKTYQDVFTGKMASKTELLLFECV